MLAFIKGNGLAGELWIALDDQAQLFWDDTENPPDNLFYLNGEQGFADAVAELFMQRLRDMQ